MPPPRVFLDESPIAVPHDSVAGAIEAARQVAEARGRLVIDVLLDGRRLDGDELAQPSDQPLGARELRFASTEPRAFVAQALLDGADELEGITTRQQQAATHLRAGELAAAFEHLTAAIESWELIRRAAQDGPALLDVPFASIKVTIDGDTQPLTAHIESLVSDLRALENALSIQDWSTIGDLLSHELDERAATWRHVLTDLACQIQPSGSR